MFRGSEAYILQLAIFKVVMAIASPRTIIVLINEINEYQDGTEKIKQRGVISRKKFAVLRCERR